jgi:hypothetical protein
MLIHEITDGTYGVIGEGLYVHVPGAPRAELVPRHVKVTHEKDGTLTLHGPLYTMISGTLHSAFLIHDEWFVQQTATRAA